MPTTTAPEPLVDDLVRSAEAQVFAAYGLTRTEEWVDLTTANGRYSVRLQQFGEGARGAPPVVLLHGVGSMQALAAPLLPYLAGRRVIAVDWPGHGLSGPCILPPTTDLRRFASSVLDSLLTEIDETRIDLVGHSLGAQFSLYAALDLAPHVRRIALLGAPGAAFTGAKPATMMKVMALPRIGARLLSRKLTDEMFVKLNEDYILGRHAFRDAPPAMASVGSLLASRPGNAQSVASFFRALIRGNQIRDGIAIPHADLARMSQPALMAWGDEDVFLTPASAATSIVSIRDIRLIRLPNAGHAPWLNNPRAVGEALAEHLAL